MSRRSSQTPASARLGRARLGPAAQVDDQVTSGADDVEAGEHHERALRRADSGSSTHGERSDRDQEAAERADRADDADRGGGLLGRAERRGRALGGAGVGRALGLGAARSPGSSGTSSRCRCRWRRRRSRKKPRNHGNQRLVVASAIARVGGRGSGSSCGQRPQHRRACRRSCAPNAPRVTRAPPYLSASQPPSGRVERADQGAEERVVGEVDAGAERCRLGRPRSSA